MSALAGQLLDDLTGGALYPSAAGGEDEELIVDLLRRDSLVDDLFSAILWVLEQVQGAWKFVGPLARQIGKDLEKVAGDQDALWEHLVDVLLPHTLGHLVGYVYSDGIVPLRVRAGRLESSVRFLMGWRGQIDTWRKDTVDPTLQGWRDFHHWFDVNAAPAIATLDDWLKRPAHFADWATPVLGAPIFTWLVTKASDSLIDAVTAKLVDSTPDVWRHVEQAATHVLLQAQ